nr:MAG TPA: hypothetical protein [Caudoviricetes sp.]
MICRSVRGERFVQALQLSATSRTRDNILVSGYKRS